MLCIIAQFSLLCTLSLEDLDLGFLFVALGVFVDNISCVQLQNQC